MLNNKNKESTYIKRLLKSQLKSPWMLLMIIPILLITILIVQAKDGSIFTIAGLMNYFGFYNMFMGVVYATYGGYVSLSIDEYEFSIFSKSKVLLLRIISGMLVAMASVLCILLVMSAVSYTHLCGIPDHLTLP